MAEDVVDKIEHDHREVEELFAEFEQSGDRAVALKICDELDAHTAAEEAEVYPVVAAMLDEEAVEHAEDEHAEAKDLIARIRASQGDTELRQLVSELRSAIEHHVEEEESELLPAARAQLSDAQLEDLGTKFEEAKEQAGS